MYGWGISADASKVVLNAGGKAGGVRTGVDVAVGTGVEVGGGVGVRVEVGGGTDCVARISAWLKIAVRVMSGVGSLEDNAEQPTAEKKNG